MSYVLEQTEALVAVLERVTPFASHRLAAYAVNAEFWASDVRHCHELLDGYIHRWQRMRQATEEYLREHPISTGQQDFDTRTTRGTKDSEIRAARQRLDEAAQRFFARCHRAGLLSDERLNQIGSLLGYELMERE
jgi:ElaB/YqjD/DUF883 family membrane-anchored ribosome-binding protein